MTNRMLLHFGLVQIRAGDVGGGLSLAYSERFSFSHLQKDNDRCSVANTV